MHSPLVGVGLDADMPGGGGGESGGEGDAGGNGGVGGTGGGLGGAGAVELVGQPLGAHCRHLRRHTGRQVAVLREQC